MHHSPGKHQANRAADPHRSPEILQVRNASLPRVGIRPESKFVDPHQPPDHAKPEMHGLPQILPSLKCMGPPEFCQVRNASFPAKQKSTIPRIRMGPQILPSLKCMGPPQILLQPIRSTSTILFHIILPLHPFRYQTAPLRSAYTPTVQEPCPSKGSRSKTYHSNISRSGSARSSLRRESWPWVSEPHHSIPFHVESFHVALLPGNPSKSSFLCHWNGRRSGMVAVLPSCRLKGSSWNGGLLESGAVLESFFFGMV